MYITFEEAQDLFYESHTCMYDDSEMEEARIMRWAEEMGYEIVD